MAPSRSSRYRLVLGSEALLSRNPTPRRDSDYAHYLSPSSFDCLSAVNPHPPSASVAAYPT